MAEGNFGGGGSVKWALDINDDERGNVAGKKTHFDQSAAKGCKVNGIDKDCDTHFQVSVTVPGITSPGDFVAFLLDPARGNLTVGGHTAKFKLARDEDDDRQIKVRWK